MSSSMTRVFTVMAIILLLCVDIAGAVTFTEKHKKNIYLGVLLPYSTISGDFDATKYLVTTIGDYRIPDLDGAAGIGGVVGYSHMGEKLGFAAEMSYQRTSHDATYFTWTGDATLHMISIDVKGLYLSMPMQPYLLVGMAIPQLVVKDALMSASETDKITYKGYGLNLGGGINLFLHPNICLNGSAVYRIINYSRAKISLGEDDIPDGGLGGSGLSMNAGLIFYWPLTR